MGQLAPYLPASVSDLVAPEPLRRPGAPREAATDSSVFVNHDGRLILSVAHPSGVLAWDIPPSGEVRAARRAIAHVEVAGARLVRAFESQTIGNFNIFIAFVSDSSPSTVQIWSHFADT